MTVYGGMLCSLLGGIISSVTTLPLDVIVSQTQQQANSGKKVSPMKEIARNYREGGLNQIKDVYTRGIEARMVRRTLLPFEHPQRQPHGESNCTHLR